MLKRIENLPDGVVGVEASGEVTADDYRTVLIPLVDGARAKGKIRLLYVYSDVGISAGAAWQDAKLGIENWTAFERIAVVTDKDWIENSIKAMGWIMPGEVQVFDDDDRDDAVTWLAS
jgi:hypothetical protein